MISNIAKVSDNVNASVQKATDVDNHVKLGGVFYFKCYDKDGNLKWEDSTHNLVVNVGLKHLNDTFFSGSSYTATWYLGLVNASPAPSYAAGDTLASHAGIHAFRSKPVVWLWRAKSFSQRPERFSAGSCLR